MGFDVMSRRVRVQSSTSSSPSPSSRSRSLERDRFMADAFFHKSLTPNRKHHKLLKDGSEVWSEDVEKVFVEGLREYWESPWATYSRGRSRWRNQFLVDYLKKAGIERSKKQVASHIQVLRNMWRGEPEFHLVAGGEELFTENGLLASPKDNKAGDGTLPSMEPSPLDVPSSSSSSSTPEYRAVDFTASPSLAPALPKAHSPLSTLRPLGPSPEQDMFASASVLPFSLPLGSPPPSPPSTRHSGGPVKLEPLHMSPGLSSLPSGSMSGYVGSAGASPIFPLSHPTNRLLNLNLWAEGMSMYTADVDRLSAAMAMPPPAPHDYPPSILFRIKVSISSIEDIHSSPNLHGFQGAITLSSRWTSSAQCVTKLYSGQACINQETAFLEALPSSHGTNLPHSVMCALPDSALSRCKWLPKDQDRITQQILVDGIIVAAFVYTLERTIIPGSPPSAELQGFQKYRVPPRGRTTSHPIFSPSHSPEASHASAAFYSSGSYNTLTRQTSLPAQLPQDAIDPSLIHGGPYSSSLGSTLLGSSSTGMLY